MINCLRLLRNIGQFDSVATGTALQLQHNVFIYAENGRGKTTLTAIIRSLQTGDSLHILERRRLSAAHPPQVVLDCAGGPPNAIFQNGTWNRTLPDIAIFDDRFVDENVCSGLDVDSAHRQRLHELVLDSHGVALNRDLATLVRQIEADNARMRAAANGIPLADRGGLSVDDFCDLPRQIAIGQLILEEERSLAAAEQSASVAASGTFEALQVPGFNLDEIARTLQRSLLALDAEAMRRVQEHIAAIGDWGESWVSQGMTRLNGQDCPFCAQPLERSPVLNAYREYFGEGYTALKSEIAAYAQEVQRTHSGEVTAAFERNFRVIVQRGQFWGTFTEIPDLTLDTASIVRDWQAANRAVSSALTAKSQAPLEPIQLSVEDTAAVEVHQRNRARLDAYNERLVEANRSVAVVKERAGNANADVIRANLVRLMSGPRTP